MNKKTKLHSSEPEKKNHINWKYYEMVSDLLIFFSYFRDQQVNENYKINERTSQLLLAAQGIGFNVQLKTKIIQEIVENNETTRDWDQLCLDGQFTVSKKNYLFSSLLVQLNSISSSFSQCENSPPNFIYSRDLLFPPKVGNLNIFSFFFSNDNKK